MSLFPSFSFQIETGHSESVVRAEFFETYNKQYELTGKASLLFLLYVAMHIVLNEQIP